MRSQDTPSPHPDMEHPSDHEAVDVKQRKTSLRSHKASIAVAAALLVVAVMAAVSGRFDTFAQGIAQLFRPAAEVEEPLLAESAPVAERARGSYTFKELDIHPDLLFRPYTAGSFFAEGVSSVQARRIEEFRQFLELYEQRQGIDDNFTIRVVDGRNDKLLELFTLDEERARFEQNATDGSWNWGRVDGLRREATNRLVSKWADKGVPREAITIKWGRANQVLEARRREEGFVEYEVRLARSLGLSLLATEIGTVETFNDDRLVSPVGARSRYQMMPYLLRQHGIHHYDLKTAAGTTIPVYEEWHPFLTMEASFKTLAGYVNAVGHEIPGISAYHTGPGNIYNVYRLFLTKMGSELPSGTNVMDAYVWAVTTGYPEVSKNSSFKTYSRGYVASIYGSLRATDEVPVDPSKTIEAERVQLKEGSSLLLSQLVTKLEEVQDGLDWGPIASEESVLERFRALNPHIQVPKSESAAVNPRFDARFVAEANGAPVRFFLPLGATEALRRAGVDAFDPSKTFRFDETTFRPPSAAERTLWDRQYDQLVEDIRHFGFTPENRRSLYSLTERFRELAEAQPTHYRKMQLEVIETHKRIWQYGAFDQMASLVEATMGGTRLRARPPVRVTPSTTFPSPGVMP